MTEKSYQRLDLIKLNQAARCGSITDAEPKVCNSMRHKLEEKVTLTVSQRRAAEQRGSNILCTQV